MRNRHMSGYLLAIAVDFFVYFGSLYSEKAITELSAIGGHDSASASTW